MMSVSSLIFAFLVTPSGTTTMEVAGWIAFLLLLLHRDRRAARRGEGKEGGSAIVEEERRSVKDAASDGPATHPALRRRPAVAGVVVANAVANLSAERISRDGDGVDVGEDANGASAYPPTEPSWTLPRLSTTKRYVELTILAYILDAVLFLMISILMHKSILFIPTPCSNTSTIITATCNYSFDFDREFYWVNPSTNDSLHAVFIKGRDSSGARRRSPILFTHGNSYNLAYTSFVQGYLSLQRLGYDVYAWDYPDYGKSRLNPASEMTLQRFHQDAEFILGKISHISGTDSKDVILWGFSMGGAISAALAIQRPVNAIVLHYPPDRFDWIVREGTKLTGWLSALPQYKILDVFSLMKHMRTPTRVLHLAAEFDHYVTHARQEHLFAQLPPHVRARSRFVTIAGVGHDGIPLEDSRLPGILDEFLAEEL